MNLQDKEFLKLQAEWDKKLKDSGFNDIERREDDRLKSWATKITISHTPLEAEAKSAYYRAAGQFLHHYPFANETEKRIFSLHNDGVSIRDTVKILKAEKLWFDRGRRPCKFTVHGVLRRLQGILLSQIKRELTSD